MTLPSRLMSLSLASVLGLLSGCSKDAELALCDALLPQAEIAVNTSMDAPVVRKQLSRQQLGRLLKLSSEDGRAMGATRANPQQTVRVWVNSIPISGGVCVRPNFEVELQVRNVTVEVAKEFDTGGCLEKEVLNHEMRHVRAYEEQLALTRVEVERRLRQSFPAPSLYRFKSHEEALRSLEAQATQWLLPHVSMVFSHVDEKHRAIDTEQEYRRLSTVCQTPSPQVVATAAP